MVRQKSLPILAAAFVFALLLPMVLAANVTIEIFKPDGYALANATVNVIGINYSQSFITNDRGFFTANLTDGQNYLVVAYGDDFRIIGMVINAHDNQTVTLNASEYNLTQVNVSPASLVINGTFFYNDYSNLSAEIEFPMKLYVEPISNFTLKFPTEVKKGAYVFKLK
jgi:hypothetical protein